MRLSRSLVLLVLPPLAVTLLGGCTPPPAPPAPAPAPQAPTEQQAQAVQAEILKVSPNWIVGKVAGVKDGMAAVTDIPYASVKEPKSIQFLDANSAVIANGTVSTASDKDSQYLIVEFMPATTAGGRAPIKGDIAVYIPK
jgi:hypothetical protein